MSGDDVMREFGKQMPVPEFESTAFTAPTKPLSESTVAIVTTSALHRQGEEGYTPGDVRFKPLDRADRDLVLGHWSPNFDRSGVQIDLNVVYPIDRLEELAADGTIGQVSQTHYAFAGNQPDTVSEIRLDTGPACAQELLAAGVDVVVLTPV